MSPEQLRPAAVAGIGIVVQKKQRIRAPVAPAISDRCDEAWLVCERPSLELVEQENLEGFARVIEVDAIDAGWLAGFVGRRVAEGTSVRLLTNDEYCLEWCDQVNQQYGLPRTLPSNLGCFLDKVEMKSRLRAAGIRTPRFVALDGDVVARDAADQASHVLRELSLPLVGKPARESNSRGVAVLRDRGALERWLAAVDGGSQVELEEFVPGTLFHCNALVEGGRVHPLLVGEYLNPPLELSTGRAIGSISVPKEGGIGRDVVAFHHEVLSALAADGAFVTHLEVFRDPSGELVFLEIAARAPGALVSKMGELHCGLELELLNFSLQLGDRASVEPVPGPHAAWIWQPSGGAALPRLASSHRTRLVTGPRSASAGGMHELLLWDSDPARLRADFESFRVAGSP